MSEPNKDCLLAVVNDCNDVIDSVLMSEYVKNPSNYKVFCIRVLPISENKEFILSSDVFFDESAYDTQYSTILRYDEDYATAFARINDALPTVEKHFVTQYKNESGKYNTVVRLYYVRQSVEEAKSLQKEVVLYPGEVATDDILNNRMLFGEIAFIKDNIIPNLDLNIQCE